MPGPADARVAGPSPTLQHGRWAGCDWIGACPADAAGRSRTPLVALHGIGSTASGWGDLIRRLGAERPVVAWTWPGYGASEGEVAASWPEAVAALAAFLQAGALGPVCLLGHSLGGMLAQAHRAARPEQLSGVVLSASSLGFGHVGADWKARHRAQRLDAVAADETLGPGAAKALQRLSASPIAQADTAAFQDSANEIRTSAYARAVDLMLAFDGRAWPAHDRVRVPLRVLAGAMDPLIPLAAQDALAAQCSDQPPVVLERVGHLPHLEAPAAHAAQLSRFLAELPAR